MKELLEQHDFIVAEAAIVERLRRNKLIELDGRLMHAPWYLLKRVGLH
ncbi:MAG: hypothetical protein V7760_04200 [Marinobacter sp.]